MEINFKVSNLDISYTRPESRVINDSINYIEATFAFEGEVWNEHKTIKTVIFKNKDASLSVVLEGNKCVVPFEVLKSTGFQVGVKGTYTENDAPVTVHTRDCMVRTERSCCVEEFDNGLTPSQYEQLVGLISSESGGDISITYDTENERLDISGSDTKIEYDEETEDLKIGGWT